MPSIITREGVVIHQVELTQAQKERDGPLCSAGSWSCIRRPSTRSGTERLRPHKRSREVRFPPRSPSVRGHPPGGYLLTDLSIEYLFRSLPGWGWPPAHTPP